MKKSFDCSKPSQASEGNEPLLYPNQKNQDRLFQVLSSIVLLKGK